ncbi:hypothetical protein PGT21_017770 [Puccinia graminis f. sp. tritici]|uniref:Uncharacterized protein n=1 Tax=Puccinia graminis f. sp. tritici TaxID=56615 RepID=A0A5B0P5T2_PUCGR|nr:hypothetical protein PGT21_017770 [Puccinia graminis f. sp. tritici]
MHDCWVGCWLSSFLAGRAMCEENAPGYCSFEAKTVGHRLNDDHPPMWCPEKPIFPTGLQEFGTYIHIHQWLSVGERGGNWHYPPVRLFKQASDQAITLALIGRTRWVALAPLNVLFLFSLSRAVINGLFRKHPNITLICEHKRSFYWLVGLSRVARFFSSATPDLSILSNTKLSFPNPTLLCQRFPPVWVDPHAPSSRRRVPKLRPIMQKDKRASDVLCCESWISSE